MLKQSNISWSIFDLPSKETELAKLQQASEDSNLWNNVQKAQQLMKQIADLRNEIESWQSLERRTKDALELVQMQDESLLAGTRKGNH